MLHSRPIGIGHSNEKIAGSEGQGAGCDCSHSFVKMRGYEWSGGLWQGV
jgi:hypothetical protein